MAPGRLRGPPFTELGVMSDAALVADALYGVAGSAGTLHPQWTYYFDTGQYTWLASVLVLNPGP